MFLRLPKTAQERIRWLERENDKLSEKLAAISGEKETRIEIDPHGAHNTARRRFIEAYASIRFKCGEQRYVDVRLKGNGVDVFADAFGRESLVILPGASNHFHIGFAEVEK
jgi:hypothetical protein